MMMAEVNTMMTPVLTSLNHDKILRALQITDREQMTETLDAQIRRCEAVVAHGIQQPDEGIVLLAVDVV